MNEKQNKIAILSKAAARYDKAQKELSRAIRKSRLTNFLIGDNHPHRVEYENAKKALQIAVINAHVPEQFHGIF